MPGLWAKHHGYVHVDGAFHLGAFGIDGFERYNELHRHGRFLGFEYHPAGCALGGTKRYFAYLRCVDLYGVLGKGYVDYFGPLFFG